MIAAFGLRAREAWSFRPHLSVGPLGSIEVNKGTKGGVLLDLYERLAGVPAPVRGGDAPPDSPDREREARKIVAEAAGHSRPQVSSAYLGSRRQSNVDASPKRPDDPLPDEMPTTS